MGLGGCRLAVGLALSIHHPEQSLVLKWSTTSAVDLDAKMDEVDSDFLITYLSFRPKDVEAVMTIRNVSTPKFMATSPNINASFGLLDKLPIELLHIALGYLDLQSLFSLLLANSACRLLVESLPAYKRTVAHATNALDALSRTKTLREHSVNRLCAALCSEKCSVCRKYGNYLFVVTAERSCLRCFYKETNCQSDASFPCCILLWNSSQEHCKTSKYACSSGLSSWLVSRAHHWQAKRDPRQRRTRNNPERCSPRFGRCNGEIRVGQKRFDVASLW